MFKRKSNAFTLIELIATLVIMSIIALIVTPLVMNIIRKARISADKRSVDAYGRSIELAIAGYLLDTGKFPTEVSQLTIEYSGNKVECETTQINTDSSVYLAGCTVAGRSTGDYTYGEEEVITYDVYSVGDEVTYNNVDYRVIKDFGTKESTVTLLKAEPLTVSEVNQYGGVGTANNHVNMYTPNDMSDPYYQTANDYNGYGGMEYYTSATCRWDNGDYIATGCTTNYAQSEIKYVVDAWKTDQAPAASEARLITDDEIIENFGYEYYEVGTSSRYRKTESTPSWIYNSDYKYWTMSQFYDSSTSVWNVNDDGDIGGGGIYTGTLVVRPVIVLPKSELSA